MREVRVHLDEGPPVAVITLPVGLDALMSPGVAYPWGAGRIRARSADRLHLEQTPEGGSADLWAVLSGLQSGLLLLALSKARLVEPDAYQPVPDLARHAVTCEVRLSGGEAAFLAFWAGSVSRERAIRVSSGRGLTPFLLQRGRAKSRPRLSLLLPSKMRDWGVDRVTASQVLRLAPRFLYDGPDGGADRVVSPEEAAVPVSEWEDPFRDLFGRDADPAPPVPLLDRVSERGCQRLLAPPVTGRPRPPTLRALTLAWAIGAGGEGLGVRRLRPPARVEARLRDRARVIDELAAERDAELLRSVLRVSALQAWRIGHDGRDGGVRAPQGTFLEEREAGLRDLSPDAQEALLRIHAGRGVPHRFGAALRELLRAGLIGSVKGRDLTPLGAELLRPSLERPDDAPSIRQIARPDAAVMRTLRVVPDRTEPPVPLPGPEEDEEGWDAPFRDLLIRDAGVSCPLEELERVADRAVRSVADPDLTRKRFHRALTRACQLGRSGADGRDPRAQLPPLLTGFLRERARALTTLTGPGVPLEELTLLVRVSCLQAWRVGVRSADRRFRGLDSRFREEGPRELWPVSQGGRDLLGRVRSGDVDHGGPEAEELAREGLIRSVTEPELTEAGRSALSGLAALRRAPSLRELATPRRRAVARLSPEPLAPTRKRPRRKEEGPRPEGLGSRALTDEEVDAIRTEAGLRALLVRAWSEGQFGPEGASPRRRSVPRVISLFLAERARVVWGVRSGRGLTGPVRDLIRSQVAEAVRLGTRTPKLRVPAPPPEYREECSVPMRAVPAELRDLLIGIHQGRVTGRLPVGAGPTLRLKGVLVGKGLGGLTPAGEEAALAELEHRTRPLPSILPER